MGSLRTILNILHGVRRMLSTANIDDDVYRKLVRHIDIVIERLSQILKQAQKGQLSLKLEDAEGWPIANEPIPNSSVDTKKHYPVQNHLNFP